MSCGEHTLSVWDGSHPIPNGTSMRNECSGWEPAHKIADRGHPVSGSLSVTNACDHDLLDVEES